MDKKEKDNSQKLVSFLRPGTTASKGASIVSTAKQVGQTLNTQRILVVGPGNFLGLEDLARLKPHSYSVRCVSTTGVIILLEPEKFNSIVKHIPDGFKEITRINKLKWKSYYDTLARLEDQKHEMIGRQKQLINESSDTFTNMAPKPQNPAVIKYN